MPNRRDLPYGFHKFEELGGDKYGGPCQYGCGTVLAGLESTIPAGLELKGLCPGNPIENGSLMTAEEHREAIIRLNLQEAQRQIADLSARNAALEKAETLDKAELVATIELLNKRLLARMAWIARVEALVREAPKTDE